MAKTERKIQKSTKQIHPWKSRMFTAFDGHTNPGEIRAATSQLQQVVSISSSIGMGVGSTCRPVGCSGEHNRDLATERNRRQKGTTLMGHESYTAEFMSWVTVCRKAYMQLHPFQVKSLLTRKKQNSYHHVKISIVVMLILNQVYATCAQ